MSRDAFLIVIAILYSLMMVALGRRLRPVAAGAAYGTALAGLVAMPLLSDATAHRVDDLLGVSGAGRLLCYLAVMIVLCGACLTVMLEINPWARGQWLAVGGAAVFTGGFVLCWFRVQALDLPQMAAVFYGPRVGSPPPVLWMNVVAGLGIGYIVLWGVRAFLPWLRRGRSPYEQGVAWALIVVYILSGCNGMLTLIEAVAHHYGMDILGLYRLQNVLKVVAPALMVGILIGQRWLWPLWRGRRDLLVRWLAPELTQLRWDLLNLSAVEAERHLDIHPTAYANRAIVEDVLTRCRAVGIPPARRAIAQMAVSLITVQRENLLQDPGYGLETSWEALREAAAAEINRGMATTAWERALRDAYISQHVYCLIFLVLDGRAFRDLLLIDKRPPLHAWHLQLAEIIAAVMQVHGHPTPRTTTGARGPGPGRRFPRRRGPRAWRRGRALDAAGHPGPRASTP